MGFAGLNVTHLHKQRILDHIDWISDDVQRIGASNTIAFYGTGIDAHNTDCLGYAAAIREELADAEKTGGPQRSSVARRNKSGPSEYLAKPQRHGNTVKPHTGCGAVYLTSALSRGFRCLPAKICVVLVEPGRYTPRPCKMILSRKR